MTLSVLLLGCPSERRGVPDGGAQAEEPTTKAKLLKARKLFPRSKRDKAASKVTWRYSLEHPISGIHVTPEGEIVAIGERRFSVLDRRGRQQWYHNMAPADQVVPSGGCLAIHLSDGRTLTGLGDQGTFSWQRRVDGAITPLADGTILAADAASIRAIDCQRGVDSWMFSPDRIRSVRFLEATESSINLLGEIGQHRFLFSVDRSGRLLSTSPLPEATIWATVLNPERTLARQREALSVVGRGGVVWWTAPITPSTDVTLHRGQVVLTNTSSDGVISSRRYERTGRAGPRCSVQVGAEPVSLKVLGSERYPLLFTACAGALSSCAVGTLTAGSFNRLWACPSTGREAIGLVDAESEIFFDISFGQDSLVAVATTSSGRETHVVELDPALKGVQLATLSGRRMLGPVPGPDGLWLVATCQGLRCEEPWTLYAIAGQEER